MRFPTAISCAAALCAGLGLTACMAEGPPATGLADAGLPRLLAEVQPGEERMVGGCAEVETPTGREVICADGLATFYPVTVRNHDGSALTAAEIPEAADFADAACHAAGHGPVDRENPDIAGGVITFVSCGYAPPRP